MARELKAKVRLEGDARGADRAIKKTQTGFQRLTSFLTSKLVVATAAVGAAFYALSRVFSSVTEAAKIQEDAVHALDASLVSLGDEAAGVSKRLQAYAAELQKVTRVGDETIIRGQALVATFTKNEEEIKKATLAALNLSAAVGVDLNAAFLLMGKAAAGETSTLSRYGIVLDKNVPASEKFAAVLEKINAQFAGQAQARAKTYSGLLEQIGNAWGDLKEKVGDAIIKNEQVLAALTKLRDLFTTGGLVSATEALATGVGRLATASANAGVAVFEFSRALGDFARGLGAAQAAGGLLSATIEKIGSGFDLLGKAIAGVTSPLRYVVGSFKELGEAQRVTAEATIANIKAQYEIAKRLWATEDATRAAEEAAKKYGLSAADTAGLIEMWASAEERLARIFGEEEESLKSATEIAKKYGVAIEAEVVARLAQQAEELEKLREAERRGLISRKEFIAIQAQMKQSTDDLTTSVGDATTSLDTWRDGAESAGQSADRLAAKNVELAASFQRVTTASRAAPGGAGSILPDPFAGLKGGTFTVVGDKKFAQVLPSGRVIFI